MATRRLFRNALRATRDVLLGPPEVDLISRLAREDRRWSTMCEAIEYINYEKIPGDILEFGVFTGVSLALLTKAQSIDPKGVTRRIVGFDAFEGLPASIDVHARWRRGDCTTINGWHPFLTAGERVTSETVKQLFVACGLPAPELEVGWFVDTLPHVIPTRYSQAALLHIDCDLYESTLQVLTAVSPALQDGTLVLFDDWFHYKGNPNKGEARTFQEFLQGHPQWGAVQYRPYGTFGNSFIVYKK